MREDIKALMDCGGIYVLPGWMESRGATMEVELASTLHFEWINHE
jgi:hypothetical protein